MATALAEFVAFVFRIFVELVQLTIDAAFLPLLHIPSWFWDCAAANFTKTKTRAVNGSERWRSSSLPSASTKD